MTTQPVSRPETFVVGETVAMVVGECSQRVTVTAVEGGTVKVQTSYSTEHEFVVRERDGRHVRPDHMDAVVMPDMIAHYRVTEPAKPSLLNRVKSLFQ